MSIPVALFKLTRGGKEYAFLPGSVSFGDGETLSVKINHFGTVDTIDLKKKQVTLKLEGAVGVDLTTFLSERENNVISMLNSNPIGEDINVFGYIIERAYLKEVTPTAPVQVAGISLFDSIDLLYQSQDYV